MQTAVLSNLPCASNCKPDSIRSIPVRGEVAERGQPHAIRCDNGADLTSRHFLAWRVERQIELVHIQPGKPTQNVGCPTLRSLKGGI
jgi:transposase InsO family protein